MPIVAAIGRSDHAERVVEEAARLSDRVGVELHVVHVAGQYESTERVRLDALDESTDPVELDDEARARAHAESVASAATDSFTPVGLVGYADAEVLRYADEVDAEYVVIGGRKRSPIGKAVFGSTAQSIMLDADRPVVMVPPASKASQ
ncbi:universal stress protein [Halobacterium yunchengense]|uniref:universal stress protein n=1 Tax=Halobacterium yunchengense TaxID=3108497 RepID=UPI0030098B64